MELGASAATLALRLERWRRRKRRPGLEHESERGACDRGATGRAKGGRPGRAEGAAASLETGFPPWSRGAGRPSPAPFQREGRLRVTADRHRGGRPGRVCLGPADSGWGEDSPRGGGPQSVQRAGDVVGQGRELDPQRGGEARHRGVGGFPTLVCLCRVLGCPCPGSLLPPRPFLCPQVSPSAWKSPGAPLHREEGGAKAASRGHHPTPHGGQIPSGGSAASGLSAPWGGSPARPCSEGMATSGPGDTRGRDGNRSEQRRQALALRGSPAAGVRARLRPPSLCLPSAPPGGGKPRSQCWRLGEPPGPSLAHALQSKESVLVTATGGVRAGDPGGHRGQSTGPARGRRGPSSTAAWGRPHPPPRPACQSRRFFKRF